jgi:hypothetical protein
MEMNLTLLNLEIKGTLVNFLTYTFFLKYSLMAIIYFFCRIAALAYNNVTLNLTKERKKPSVPRETFPNVYDSLMVSQRQAGKFEL